MKQELDTREYNRRIRAWTMYDWANSAFATTILAAVLPIYYSQVAGSTLPSAAAATARWSLGLSLSLLLMAILSPILGTVSDIVRGKKRLLSLFAGVGIVATGLLVLVNSGDWLLASLLFVFGRIGFAGANVFYDSLLPHVATKGDQDRVSTRGFAVGYLGGGILLAINVVMIQVLPGTWGPRLSFLSVAVWWAVFSVPLFLRVPEPATAVEKLTEGQTVLSRSFERLRDTLRDIRQYRDLFLFLLAFLIYIDGVGTIISLASIYAAELGLGTIETILALLLVQFVGIPFSIIFGRLPERGKYRSAFLGFMLFNMIVLPVAGIVGVRVLPAGITGAAPEPFITTATAVGEGEYTVADPEVLLVGTWRKELIPTRVIRTDEDQSYAETDEPGDSMQLTFNGQKLELIYGTGPNHGMMRIEIDGEAALDEEDEPVVINGYHVTKRYEAKTVILAKDPGEHTLAVLNDGTKDRSSTGTTVQISRITVLPPIRQSNLPIIIAIIVAIQVIGILFGLALGRVLFSRLAEKLDTKRSILLALLVYTIIVIWGFFLDSVIEFWILAWMVASVQGGSQALSRSLYSSMIPKAKSGQFFGLFSVMAKFASILGPLVFAVVIRIFGSSRPAVLSLIVFFVVGIIILRGVDVDRGREVARAEDQKLEEESG